MGQVEVEVRIKPERRGGWDGNKPRMGGGPTTAEESGFGGGGHGVVESREWKCV